MGPGFILSTRWSEKELFWAITETMPHSTKHIRLLAKNRPCTWLPNGGSALKPLDLDRKVFGSRAPVF